MKLLQKNLPILNRNMENMLERKIKKKQKLNIYFYFFSAAAA